MLALRGNRRRSHLTIARAGPLAFVQLGGTSCTMRVRGMMIIRLKSFCAMLASPDETTFLRIVAGISQFQCIAGGT